MLKLTLFVGSLVGLTAGTLITVGYYYTGRMLSDQIDARLSGIADDRQALLKSELVHLADRPGWSPVALGCETSWISMPEAHHRRHPSHRHDSHPR